MVNLPQGPRLDHRVANAQLGGSHPAAGFPTYLEHVTACYRLLELQDAKACSYQHSVLKPGFQHMHYVAPEGKLCPIVAGTAATPLLVPRGQHLLFGIAAAMQ